MDLFQALVIFSITWWLAFFVTLPFGVKRPQAAEPGHEPGAPEHPRLWVKAGIATAAAATVTGFAAVAVAYDLIPFRALVE
ncbi:MAG: DUF1467 family protein [Alphaproteobacteria bacterium]